MSDSVFVFSLQVDYACRAVELHFIKNRLPFHA